MFAYKRFEFFTERYGFDMEIISRDRNIDRVKSVTPEKLVASGVSIDHDSPPMLGGVFKDDDGVKFWVVTVDEENRAAVQAGLATVLSPRFVLPEDMDIAECVALALASISLAAQTNV